jgi:hypothetical protein
MLNRIENGIACHNLVISLGDYVDVIKVSFEPGTPCYCKLFYFCVFTTICSGI